jgi:hypothetical protein
MRALFVVLCGVFLAHGMFAMGRALEDMYFWDCFGRVVIYPKILVDEKPIVACMIAEHPVGYPASKLMQVNVFEWVVEWMSKRK